MFLFLFAIYYAVSSLAGVLWRNAVVSIVVTILFWAACFVVGTTKNVMEQTWLNSSRLVKLVSAGETLFGVTEQGQVQQWRATEEKWEETFQAEGPDVARGGPFVLAATMDQPDLRLARGSGCWQLRPRSAARGLRRPRPGSNVVDRRPYRRLDAPQGICLHRPARRNSS